MTTLYEHAGEDEALHRLEELFYDKVLKDLLCCAQCSPSVFRVTSTT